MTTRTIQGAEGYTYYFYLTAVADAPYLDSETAETGSVKISADDKYVEFAWSGSSNSTDIDRISTPISIAFSQGSGSSAPQYYSNGTALRIYGGNTITISSEKNITKAVFTFSTAPTSENSSFSKGTMNYNTSTWEAGDDTVNQLTITNTASSGNWRIRKVVVYYKE